MKFAILSDIHSNLEALQACMRHARQQGVEQYAFVGDLVGYGADPVACIDIIAGLAQQGAIAVRGNHDDAALSGLCETMELNAREVIYWTRKQLGNNERTFISSLPLSVQHEDMLFVHACAVAPEQWTYITGPTQASRCMQASKARFTFSGHVHQPTLYFQSQTNNPQVFYPIPGVAIPLLVSRKWLAIVGSVGQPRDANPASSYAIFDCARRNLTYHRVPYDHASTARKMLAAGLPANLAQRLARGH